MKVTSDDIIKSGERELIDGITADLDWEAVEKIFRKTHQLPLGEDVSYKSGDLVVHENRIAYLLEFEVKVPLSMLLDREGNCIDIQAAPVSGTDEGMDDIPDAEAPTLREAPCDPESDASCPEMNKEPDLDPIDRRMSEAREALTGMGELSGRET
ncbi:MAG: hypothetical protein K9M82_07895 [Deltaproteobacteria bacterium]|nr:hypothetical protein [Deltaproteobacteria bacterium]